MYQKDLYKKIFYIKLLPPLLKVVKVIINLVPMFHVGIESAPLRGSSFLLRHHSLIRVMLHGCNPRFILLAISPFVRCRHHSSSPSSSSTIPANWTSAPFSSSIISRARTSGSGRLSESSNDSSRSQKISRLPCHAPSNLRS
jgi:hypothetical protein